MAEFFSPYRALIQLEEKNIAAIAKEIADLGRRKGEYLQAIELLEKRILIVKSERKMLENGSCSAAEHANMLTALRSEQIRKMELELELEKLSAEEKKMRAMMFEAMNKSRSYQQALEREETIASRRHAARQQRLMDDLIASRKSDRRLK